MAAPRNDVVPMQIGLEPARYMGSVVVVRSL